LAAPAKLADTSSRVPISLKESVMPGAPPDHLEEGPDSWAKEYESYTLGQLGDERKRILSEISRDSAPYFELAFESGDYVVAPLVETKHGQGFSLPEDELEIVRIEVDNRLRLSKTATLPRLGYQALYRLKEKALWLYDLEASRRSAPVGLAPSR